MTYRKRRMGTSKELDKFRTRQGSEFSRNRPLAFESFEILCQCVRSCLELESFVQAPGCFFTDHSQPNIPTN